MTKTAKPELKRVATKAVVERRLKAAFRQLAGIEGSAPVDIEWFDDGSGIERIIAANGDETMSMLDFDGAKALCYAEFDAYPELTEDAIWTPKANARLWEDFKKEQGLPDEVEYFAALCEEDRVRVEESWMARFDEGLIVVFREDDPT
jgi:hypothetical protein